MNTNYIPSHPYDTRVAGPPRLMIPPPPIQYVDNRPLMAIPGIASYDYQDEFGDPRFLELLIRQGCNLNHRMLEWKYEERRNAQSILPFLFLGPSTAAQDKVFLRGNGVTFLLAVRANDSLHARLTTSLKRGEEIGIQTAAVIANSPHEVIGRLPSAISAINNHLQTMSSADPFPSHSSGESHSSTRGKVLVFCENGNERSPAIVLGYLMAMYNLDTIQAIHVVQSQRFCITIDESMKQALLDFEIILRARRDVTADKRALQTYNIGRAAGSVSTELKSQKRTLEETESSDEEMIESNAPGQNLGRVGSAPFRDHGN